jgi:NAD(P)-dependent dehydrogenase (short-subunit alcohol dehydrogenase family)
MNILITGGASGLGAAITKVLAANSANNIYFTYCSSSEAAKKLEAEFSNSEAILCNFLEKTDMQTLFSKMDAMDLDVLINNALNGLTQAHFHKLLPDTFKNSFSHNVQPTLNITQKAISIFRKKKFGKIITILTSALLKPPIGMSEYVANKAYLASMSKSWAIENARFKITSNCISPSVMKTDLTNEIYEKVFDELEKNHPLKQLLTPEEVASEVLALMNSSQYVNGTNRIINAAEDVI